MCLAIPGKVIRKVNEIGVVDLGGVEKEIVMTLVPEAKTGDWVLIHTGFGINIISEEDALETIRMLKKAYEEE